MSALLLLPLPAALGASPTDTPAMLLLCLALTIGLLFYTFYFPQVGMALQKDRRTFLRERKEVVYENLRDLNFEYRAGKYPERDYQQMRASLEEEAAVLLAEIEVLDSVGDSSVSNAGALARSTKVRAGEVEKKGKR